MRRLAFIVPYLLIACGDNGGDTPDATPAPDAYVRKGTLTVTWTLADGADAIACSDVGAQLVVVSETPVKGGVTGVDTFQCQTGTGTTLTRLVGEYLVTVELQSTDGTLVSLTFPGTIIRDQQDTAITAPFDVIRRGGVKFRPDADTPSPNCELEPAGAGITAFQLELRDKAGTCVPATFHIGGSADAGTGTVFESDCTGDGIYAACIENDTWVSVEGVPSGPHQLVVTGLEGANVCYPSVADLTIPGGDLVKDLHNLLLVYDSKATDCQVP